MKDIKILILGLFLLLGCTKDNEESNPNNPNNNKKEQISVIFSKEDNVTKLNTLKIKFSKGIKTNDEKEVDNAYIESKICSFKKGGTNVSYTCNINSDKTIIVITPKQKLDYSTTYTITLNDNNINYNLEKKSYQFTTGDKSINEKLKAGSPWLIKKAMYSVTLKDGKTLDLNMLDMNCIKDNTYSYSDDKYTIKENKFICDGSSASKDFSYQITSNNKYKDDDGEWDIKQLSDTDFKVELDRDAKVSDINQLTNMYILAKLINNEMPSSDDINKFQLSITNNINKINIKLELKAKETVPDVQPEYYYISDMITYKTPAKTSGGDPWDYNVLTGSKSGADIYFKILAKDGSELYTLKDENGNEIYNTDVDPTTTYNYELKPIGLFIKKGVEYSLELYDYDASSADDLMGSWIFKINSVDVNKNTINLSSTSGDFEFAFKVKYY